MYPSPPGEPPGCFLTAPSRRNCGLEYIPNLSEWIAAYYGVGVGPSLDDIKLHLFLLISTFHDRTAKRPPIPQNPDPGDRRLLYSA